MYTLVYNNPITAMIVVLLMQAPAVLYDEFNRAQHSVFITKLYLFYNYVIKTFFFQICLQHVKDKAHITLAQSLTQIMLVHSDLCILLYSATYA